MGQNPANALARVYKLAKEWCQCHQESLRMNTGSKLGNLLEKMINGVKVISLFIPQKGVKNVLTGMEFLDTVIFEACK